jgi:hypothetical protein
MKPRGILLPYWELRRADDPLMLLALVITFSVQQLTLSDGNQRISAGIPDTYCAGLIIAIVVPRWTYSGMQRGGWHSMHVSKLD